MRVAVVRLGGQFGSDHRWLSAPVNGCTRRAARYAPRNREFDPPDKMRKFVHLLGDGRAASWPVR